MRKEKRSCFAFSLLELLLCLAILGILTAIAVGVIDQYPFQKSEVIKRFQCDVRKMQMDSIQAENQYAMIFLSDKYIIKYGTVKQEEYIFPKGWKIYEQNGEYQIGFNQRGHPKKGYSIIISSPREEILLTIVPVTGKIRVKE